MFGICQKSSRVVGPLNCCKKYRYRHRRPRWQMARILSSHRYAPKTVKTFKIIRPMSVSTLPPSSFSFKVCFPGAPLKKIKKSVNKIMIKSMIFNEISSKNRLNLKFSSTKILILNQVDTTGVAATPITWGSLAQDVSAGCANLVTTARQAAPGLFDWVVRLPKQIYDFFVKDN